LPSPWDFEGATGGSRRAFVKSLVRSGSSRLLGVLHRNDRKREAKPDLVIEADLDVIDPMFGELQATEDMYVRHVGVHFRQLELYFGLRQGLLILAVEDDGLLREFADSTAPAGEKAKLEDADGDDGRGNRANDSDEGLLTTHLCADVLTDDGGLEIRWN